MRFLLTGGSGFIGANLTDYLLRKYPDCIVINLSTYRAGQRAFTIERYLNNPRYVHVDGKIEHEGALEKTFALMPDIVIHLAGKTHVDESLQAPGATIEANVIGTQKVLDACRQYGIKRLIHISSAEVYGAEQAQNRMDEHAHLDPVNPYAASKAASDLIVQSYCRSFGLDAVILRCANNYGPFQTTEKLIPMVITRALKYKPITLYGDGSQKREWVHVADYCSAIDAAIRRGAAGQVYNVSGGQVASVKEIITYILQLTDRPWSLVKEQQGRRADIDRSALQSERFTSDTGWQAQYKLEDGLRQTVRWYEQNIEWWSLQIEAALSH